MPTPESYTPRHLADRILASRDVLEGERKQVTVPFALLQQIADVPDAELRAGLSRLQAAELLYAVSLFPELELAAINE